MDNILSELYHGILRPEEEYQPTDECRQTRKKLTAQQTMLLEKLSAIDPDMHRLFLAMLEAENAADAMDLEEAYVQGMRMGARLALGLMDGRCG